MIYFVQSISGGPIKIGTSTNVDARIKALERAYGTPLVLLETIKGGRERETEIHELFAHLRIGKTEQFRPSQEIFDFIKKPMPPKVSLEPVVPMPSLLKPMVLQVRGSQEFKNWLDELARFDGISPTAVFGRAMQRYAKSVGFTKQSPSR